MEQVNVQDSYSAAVISQRGPEGDRLKPVGVYHVECRDADGNLKWKDKVYNLVTDVGVRLLLDTILGGSNYTASVAMGLKGAGTAAVTDTMASHAGWSELGGANQPVYSGNRKVPAFSAAAGTGAGNRSKAMSAAVTFSFTGTSATVAGLFIVLAGAATKDDTTGTLLSVGDFSQGNKTVSNGDSIQASYSLGA